MTRVSPRTETTFPASPSLVEEPNIDTTDLGGLPLREMRIVADVDLVVAASMVIMPMVAGMFLLGAFGPLVRSGRRGSGRLGRGRRLCRPACREAANKLISASTATDTIASDTYRRNMDVFMGLRYLPL